LTLGFHRPRDTLGPDQVSRLMSTTFTKRELNLHRQLCSVESRGFYVTIAQLRYCLFRCMQSLSLCFQPQQSLESFSAISFMAISRDRSRLNPYHYLACQAPRRLFHGRSPSPLVWLHSGQFRQEAADLSKMGLMN
jgi:hypothetical protein